MKIENARGFRQATMLLVQNDGHVRGAMEAAQLPYTLDDVREFLDDTPTLNLVGAELKSRICGLVASAMLVATLIERGE